MATGMDVEKERLCIFCGARFRFTGTGFAHPHRSLEAEPNPCFFNGHHIGSAYMRIMDENVERLKERGLEQKPALPFL